MSNPIYQFKITVLDIKPVISRTILVPSNITFLELHGVIMELFGFEDCHLFAFNPGNQLNLAISDGTDGTKNANKIKLNQYFNQQNKISYVYDFGDDWNFTIELQKNLPRDDKLAYPQCIKWSGGMLIEDCGGSFGYEIISNWRRNKTKETKHALIEMFGDEALEWYADFNPDKFDLSSVKFRKKF